MGIQLLNPTQTVKKKHLFPDTLKTFASSTWTVGRVNMIHIELTEAQSISAINISNGATIAGNITVGIYAEGAPNTPAGGAVLVQSASTAHAGSNVFQSIAITPTWLPAGGYYIALICSDATSDIYRLGALSLYDGQGFYYDRAGGYGALTDPCPAVTAATTPIPVATLISP